MKRIYVIAGEASGDLHGANLINNLKTHAKEPIQIYGIGGDKIRATGAYGFYDLAHFHVTGLTDAIRKLPQYKAAAKSILAKIKNIRPELVVLIDNPGFNLHLAEKLTAMGIPCVYYIAPQLWAWNPKRITKIKKYIRKVFVVFEFEKKFYEDAGVPVSFVGHPLKDMLETTGEVRQIKEKIGIGADGQLVALLPGSRKGELKILLPILIEAARRIADRLPKSYFALLKAPTIPKEYYQKMLAGSGLHIDLVEKNHYEVLKASDLAVVCSGTATLECALLGTPMIITNRGTFITYVAAKAVIRIPFLGLPNIILGKPAFPELLQYDATAEKISGEALSILSNVKTRERMKRDLEEVSRRLGEPGAARRAAIEILKVLDTIKEQAGTFQVRSS